MRAGDARELAFQIEDLMRGALHVWLLALDDPELLGDSASRLLHPDESANAARFKLEMVRRRFVGTRILLRSILGRYLSVDPVDLRFQQGRYGKPRLAGTEPDRGLVFNVSHTSNQLAIALAFDARLGIDIECWRPLDDCSALASRCFAPSEWLHWNSLPEAQQLATFFRVWTLKEAFSKAVGRGLALGLQRCVFDLSASEARLLSWPADECELPHHWHFHEMQGLTRASGAVAMDHVPSGIRYYGLWRDD